MGTSRIELEHGNSTQGKVGVEVGYSKGDFNIAAGTESEIGKLKSSSENLKAESMEVKNYLKAGIGERSGKVSRDILTGGIEIEGESGEEKFKFGGKNRNVL